MNAVLLIDIGSTFTKVTAVDLETGTLLGTAKAFTTVQSDVNDGLQQAIVELQQLTGEQHYTQTLACCSAAGGLKTIAVGLVPDLTAEAAKRAALSAGAKVLKTFAFELTPSDLRDISQLQPDIILLSGGTDGGNTKVIVANARALATIDQPFTVVVAGNKSTASEPDADSFRRAQRCDAVVPRHRQASLLLDHQYIMSAMGLLAEHEPDLALRIMKQKITAI
jgi:uncharacterized protein (TIGR01319 family)